MLARRISTLLASGVLLASASNAAESVAERARVRAEIAAGLPHYDPQIRAKLPAKSEREEKPGDAAAAYGVKADAPMPAETKPETAEPEATLALPRVTVRGSRREEPALQLPRLVVRPAGKDLPAKGFETPAERDARLVKKHLNVFDRMFLNRFTLPLFGITKEKRAREAEAVEQTAKQLDEVASVLEITQQEQGDSEEAKKLAELYREVFMARPMGTQRER